MTVYHGWKNYESMQYSFEREYADKKSPVTATPENILFASYGGEDYSGYATVIFEQGGNLFEVFGSHCSCYGLEGQWEPKPVTKEALALRLPHLDIYGTEGGGSLRTHTKDARIAFYRLVRRMNGQSEDLPLDMTDPKNTPWKEWELSEEEWNDWGRMAYATEPAQA